MRTKYFPTENIESKTIANVRTVDECVKRMNGVFSLENTESEFKKEGNLQIKKSGFLRSN